MVLYTTGLILSTHFWFVTERVLSNQHPKYQQWTNSSMWPRMMSRGMLYSILFTDGSISSIVLFAGSIIVGWNDLRSNKRVKTLATDLGGTSILIALSWFVAQQLI